MKRSEIDQKLEEIVKFSEIEKFLDTPVKRYSSGMYVRLAFAVAAHLDPEILVVDEVLAVGDAAFQKKCLGKMGEVAKGGRTILFVSHNMGAITQICKSGIFLDSGKILDIGEINAVVNKYISNSTINSSHYWSTSEDPNKPLQVLEIYAVDANGKRSSFFDISDTIKIVIKHRCLKELIGAVVLVSIFSKGTELIHTFDSDAHADRLIKRQPGIYVDEIELPKRLFKAGVISISTTTAFIHKSTTIQTNNDVISVLIEEIQEDTSFKGYAAIRSGLLSITPKWTEINYNQD
jgi:lipopolysaccharide transport system ATP-binding protein